jgi:hypothetical protein
MYTIDKSCRGPFVLTHRHDKIYYEKWEDVKMRASNIPPALCTDEDVSTEPLGVSCGLRCRSTIIKYMRYSGLDALSKNLHDPNVLLGDP